MTDSRKPFMPSLVRSGRTITVIDEQGKPFRSLRVTRQLSCAAKLANELFQKYPTCAVALLGMAMDVIDEIVEGETIQ